jgi:hypothetical protein
VARAPSPRESLATETLPATTRSDPHEFVQFRCGDAAIDKPKLAAVFHLACSVEQARHCRPIEGGRKADAFDPGRNQFRHRKGFSLDSHHEIDRLRNCGADGTHRGKIRQAGGKKHVGACFFKSLKPPDGIVQVWVGIKELCARAVSIKENGSARAASAAAAIRSTAKPKS